VVAGKRALAGAVRRHRLRRRVYEILRGISRGRQFPIDVIVIAKRGTGALSFVDIQNEIRGVLIR
jgi:ribonuclease P protein component